MARVASIGATDLRHWRFHGAFELADGFSGWRLAGWSRREILGDLLLRAAREHAARVVLDVPARLRFGVFLLDQQPFVALAAPAHQHQREFAAQLFAMQAEFEIAALDLRQRRRIAQQFVAAAIPQHHAAAAVLAFRNVAFETAVVERMIFHVHGQMLWPAAPGSGLSERPRISACRPLPGESRNAGAWHRAAARRSSCRRASIGRAAPVPASYRRTACGSYSLSDMGLSDRT